MSESNDSRSVRNLPGGAVANMLRAAGERAELSVIQSARPQPAKSAPARKADLAKNGTGETKNVRSAKAGQDHKPEPEPSKEAKPRSPGAERQARARARRRAGIPAGEIPPGRKPSERTEKKIEVMESIRGIMASLSKLVATIMPEDCPMQPQGYQNDLYCRPVVKSVLLNVGRGLTVDTAATLAGISAVTVADWMEMRPAFREAVGRAEGLMENRYLAVVEAGMEIQPRLALEILERRIPARWAPVRNVTLRGGLALGLVGDGVLTHLGHLNQGDKRLLPDGTSGKKLTQVIDAKALDVGS